MSIACIVVKNNGNNDIIVNCCRVVVYKEVGSFLGADVSCAYPYETSASGGGQVIRSNDDIIGPRCGEFVFDSAVGAVVVSIIIIIIGKNVAFAVIQRHVGINTDCMLIVRPIGEKVNGFIAGCFIGESGCIGIK